MCFEQLVGRGEIGMPIAFHIPSIIVILSHDWLKITVVKSHNTETNKQHTQAKQTNKQKSHHYSPVLILLWITSRTNLFSE